jgi:outer membrane protein OmpA-like peptidoglycan-associated protein
MYHTNPLIKLTISGKRFCVQKLLREILILWGIFLLVSCATPEMQGEIDVAKKVENDKEEPASMSQPIPSLGSSSTPTYQDSPMYLRDRQIVELMPTANSEARLVNKEYYDSLDTQALLQKAQARYENQDYETASLLFNLVAERPDGRVMKTYAGLYQSHIKLENQAAAEKAFAQLLALSVKQNSRLNVKFLFSVSSTDFIENEELRREYSFWLRQIARYFKNNTLCFQMIGHSTLTEDQNDSSLSFLRAEKIQTLMKEPFPMIMQRSKVVGKGNQENLVGTNTNDVRDTIDRRVEIIVANCSEV